MRFADLRVQIMAQMDDKTGGTQPLPTVSTFLSYYYLFSLLKKK
jgi:hypothetical protein